QLSGIHGLERRPVDRARAALQGGHHAAARTAGPRARLPTGDPEGLPDRRTADDGVTCRAAWPMTLSRALSGAVVALAFACGFLADARAQTATLTVSDRGTSRSYTQQQLLSRDDTRAVTVGDPVYGRSMTYRAVPAADLMRDLRGTPDDYVQARATDNF